MSDPSFQAVAPAEWLTDHALTEGGRQARARYTQWCRYVESLGAADFKVARVKYFLQRTQYWTLPEGYALPPHTVNVCVNNQCNLHCRYCDFGQRRDETFYHQYNVVDAKRRIELPLAVCQSLVDQALWFRPIIRASFREPLLYRDILPFIEYTKSHGLPFWLLTNGSHLTKYAADLVRLGVDSVRVSVDGPESVHDAIRGVPHAYRRMLEGLTLLIEERRRQKAALQIGAYFTVNDQNCEVLEETLDQLERAGVLREIFFNFQWLLYTTREMAQAHNREHAPLCGGFVQESTAQTVDVSRINIRALSAQAQAIAKRYPAAQGYRIHFRPSFEPADLARYQATEGFPVDHPRCCVPWYNFNINPEGEVKTFHHCLLPPCGNVITTPVMDVWNGAPLREQRRQLQRHGAYLGCARCWGLYSLLEDTKRAD